MGLNEKFDKQFSTYLLYTTAALVLILVIIVRIRLLSVPLERDEGEYAYMGQLLLKNIPPFTHAYTMKLPGVSILYAFFMFMFGQTQSAIHLGLLFVNGFCVILVYLLGHKLFDRDAALASSTSYALLSLSTSELGFFAHATHFVVLFAMTGFLLLLSTKDNKKLSLLFASGLCFGLAITMKQHAVLLSFFAFIYLVWQAWRSSNIVWRQIIAESALFLIGIAIPYSLIVLWMIQVGVFNQFWFWTVQYAREYASSPGLLQAVAQFISEFFTIISNQIFLWLIAISGGISLCTKHGRCRDKFFVFGLLFFSLLSICPGFVFRQHYFILLLPVVSLLIGAAASGELLQQTSSQPRRFPQIATYLLIFAFVFGFYNERKYFFNFNPLEVSRAVYGANPFPEALQVASYLKAHTTTTDRIAVLGSEPEIYFYADRLSATGHIYMYGLMEDHPLAGRMQEEMIREIEVAKPKYVIVVNVDASWLIRPTSSQKILNWGESYVRTIYDQVGLVDIIDSGTTRYQWDNNPAAYASVSGTNLTVFRRKADI